MATFINIYYLQFQDSFANIMSKFLPTFAFGKTSEEHRISNNDLQLSNRIFKQLEQMFTVDRITECIEEKLDDVYIHLLNRFYDANHFETQFNFAHVLPEPDAPFYNFEMFSFTLNHIKVSTYIIYKNEIPLGLILNNLKISLI